MPDTLDLGRLLGDADKFIRHTGLCGIVGGYGYCTCGMEEAREALASCISELESALTATKDRADNLAIGMEEIRDASWQGDNAIERIRGTAAYYLSGAEERLDAQMRADLQARNVLGEKA